MCRDCGSAERGERSRVGDWVERPDPSCASGLAGQASGALSRAAIRDWHYAVTGLIVAGGGQGIPRGTVTITTARRTTMTGTGFAFIQGDGTWASQFTLNDSSREYLGGAPGNIGVDRWVTARRRPWNSRGDAKPNRLMP